MAGRLVVSTLNDDTGVLATQNGMRGVAKAWVNFTGSTATVNGSFNVSSITRGGTGLYTVNFTTAMPNANYCVNANQSPVYGTRYAFAAVMFSTTGPTEAVPTTSAFSYFTVDNAGNFYDPKYNLVSVFSS